MLNSIRMDELREWKQCNCNENCEHGFVPNYESSRASESSGDTTSNGLANIRRSLSSIWRAVQHLSTSTRSVSYSIRSSGKDKHVKDTKKIPPTAQPRCMLRQPISYVYLKGKYILLTSHSLSAFVQMTFRQMFCDELILYTQLNHCGFLICHRILVT